MPMNTIDFKHFPLKSGDRILDIGCGEGRHALTAYMLEDVESIGVDLSIDDLMTALHRYKEFSEPNNDSKSFYISLADGRNLPFSNNSFDKVICSEVLEHIEDHNTVLAEISRVLKVGGMLAISVPRSGPEWICWKLSDDYHAVEGGHIRIFNAVRLRREVEKIGMIFFRKHWAHALHVPYWWLRCIFWGRSEEPWIIKTYHRFLVWDLMKKPKITHYLEKLLDPIMGKSVVMYFVKGL